MDRLLRAELCWRCQGCGQQLVPAGAVAVSAAGGSSCTDSTSRLMCALGCASSTERSWSASGCVTVEDGTAEARLWVEGAALTEEMLRLPAVIHTCHPL
jgi:hypothetical protein